MDSREADAWRAAATIINGHALAFRSERDALSVESFDSILHEIVKDMASDGKRGIDRMVLLLNALAFYVVDALAALGYEEAGQLMAVVAEVHREINLDKGQDD